MSEYLFYLIYLIPLIISMFLWGRVNAVGKLNIVKACKWLFLVYWGILPAVIYYEWFGGWKDFKKVGEDVEEKL